MSARPGAADPPEPRSYYGRPVIKKPAWKTPDVPLYLFLGGLAGASSVLAAAADVTGYRHLTRVGRVTAGVGLLGSLAALIHDLGRPERFLNMLRVFKPTSPLSMGSWTLATFGPLAGAAAVSEVTGRLSSAGRAAGLAAAVLGPAMSTYTSVLIADTAVPAWHEAHRELPFVFGGSAMSAAAGAALMLAPVDEAGPAARLALAGAALELGGMERIQRGLGLVAEPYGKGRAGRLVRAAKVLTVAGAAFAVGLRRSRTGSALAGACLLGGSVVLRFAIFDAGMVSAGDPKYTVVPQHELRVRRGVRA
ncbi:MAG: polysulfide reductase NrfD [Actinomycetota bacterium]|nr:polysulfide reductase NrfD [Actinomycetota bacterium]